jgi:formate/nitrite transporter FocA (FNT family)
VPPTNPAQSRNYFERTAEHRFVARPDGDWDYFPEGLANAGKRVDSAMRDQILSQWRSADRFSFRVFLIAVAAGAVTAIGLNWRFSFDLVYGSHASQTVSLILIFAIVAPAQILVCVLARRRIGELLQGAPATGARFSPQQILELQFQHYGKHWRVKSALLVAACLGISVVAWLGAHSMLDKQDIKSQVGGIAGIVTSIVFGAGFVMLAIRRHILVRSWASLRKDQ